MPTVVAQYNTRLARRIEVEQHTACVTILKGTFCLSVDRSHADLLLRRVFRHGEHNLGLADALDG